MNFLSNYINKTSSDNLNKTLLWDFGEKDFDFKKNKKIIIQRVIEYGTIDDWAVILSIYNEKEIVAIIRQLKGLSNCNLNFVCKLFNLKKSDLICSARPRWRKTHWS